jgi:hypothetical protein
MVKAGEIYKSIDANGNVVYSDHLDSSTSQSTAVPLADRHLPPSTLHFCWTNCFTLILVNGVYRRADGTEGSWTVETFSTTAVVLHRHDSPADWNGHRQDVVYAGRVANDRLIDVTVNGKPTSGIDASWGIALNTLPGSNAERDSKSTANPDSSSGAMSSAAAPPPLPAEDQPTLAEEGLLWTPGYWYWRNRGYFWIPGGWVRPPQVGVLWTPPYWGSSGTGFVFHPGHWGSTVGFYGAVNYGYGYFGNGYTGGQWIGNSFVYNREVNHLNTAVVHRTYAESAPNQGSRGGASYAGGPIRESGARAASPHPSVSQALDKPTPVKTVSPSIPPKTNHVAPTRAVVPAKQ